MSLKEDPEEAVEPNGDNRQKRAKIASVLHEVVNGGVLDRLAEIHKTYVENTPYPYAQIHDIFQPEFLSSVMDEIKSQTRVNFKESDLFRVYQSIDMANLQPGSELANTLPNVMKLREALYSQEWKFFVEQMAGLPPSTLTDQIDCACNCHAPGCHLLCHDDVIGTRKISYIIYLTGADWKPEEGGSLELYGEQTEGDNTSSSPIPVARAWPDFNSMAFFEVRPGFSYHAVQEVLGDRPRLSLQGWYHAAEPPKDSELATLQQLKTNAPGNINGKLEHLFDSEEEEFTEADKEYLANYIQAEYLTNDSIAEIQSKFEDEDSVQLRNFLHDKWVPKIEAPKPIVYDDSYYKSGVSCEWKLRGPAHKQRFLEFQPAEHSDESNMIGDMLHHVKEKVFSSDAMARYLHKLTGLDKPTGVRSGLVRRFRPGLDYTVAHYGLLVSQSVLDATMCFVYDENQEDQDAWESGDCGGFECYIEADDDDGEAAADEYNEDDDTELLSVSASNNTLSLAFRDPGTMRFVKYVGSSAPSSRFDICMEYEVPQSEADDSEEANDTVVDADSKS